MILKNYHADRVTVLYAAPSEADAFVVHEVTLESDDRGADFDTLAWCSTEKHARLFAAAPELLAALKDLLGDLPSVQGGICQHCGRDYRDDIEEGPCPSDDCPSFHARAAIAKAEGAQ